MAKKQTKQQENKIIGFLKKPVSIYITLMLLVVVLMVFNQYIIKSTNLYVFNGFTEDVSILNGTVYTSYDINNFNGSKITYTGDDVKLKDYEIGYYVTIDGVNKPLATATSTKDSEDTYSLKELVVSSEFSFTETKKGTVAFSKDTIKNIDKMCFVISGTSTKGDSVLVNIPLDVVKVTK